MLYLKKACLGQQKKDIFEQEIDNTGNIILCILIIYF